MSWFWLNLSLGSVFATATAGIPMWMVLRHPDVQPAPAGAMDATPQSRPVIAVARRPPAGRASSPALRRNRRGAGPGRPCPGGRVSWRAVS